MHRTATTSSRLPSRLLDSPWSIAAGSDLASREDSVLNLAFQKVTNLIDPPASLFRPNIVLRVLLGGIKVR